MRPSPRAALSFMTTRLRGVRPALAACLLVLSGLVLTAPARAATSPIEAVWAFNGGEVAVVQEAGGSYTGIVDAPTKFALCTHEDGEHVWSDIRPQPDGSFWGFHQWFFETSACVRNPALGATAWRVMSAANGDRRLIVCFSQPGTSQPTISPTGLSAHVTYGCYESALLSAVPAQARSSSQAATDAFAQAVSLPGNRECFSHRVFAIHLSDPPYDPIRVAVVRLRGRRIAVVRRHSQLVSTIDLRGLPRGTFTVTISLTTVLGHHISGSRTYHTCAPKHVRKATRRAGRGSSSKARG